MLDSRAKARFWNHRGAKIGAALTLALIGFALFGPWVAGHDPYASDFTHGYSSATGFPVAPSRDFLLGTDRLFRDQLARLALGARISLTIAFAATVISTLLGGAVGIVAGYYEGSPGMRVPWPCLAALAGAVALAISKGTWGPPLAVLGFGALGGLVGTLAERRGIPWLARGPRVNIDVLLMRLVDVGLCFPFLLLVMAIGAALERTTLTSVLLVLGLTGWLSAARLFRAKTMQIRSFAYVEASRALGQSTPRILLRHVLPNVAGTFIVIATLATAQMILAESALSYLGVGLAPPMPTWGRMLFEGQDVYAAAPWLVLAPAAAILTAVLGFNLLGEGLRDALDPRQD
ncbi:ABC transporter permease [Pendulispora brunnea]|uniref:ABC transporter permease n=1 Tax=Pendulispora brunnea TaxID=2905690 RepID=A0ABZ2KML3_9BACT